MTEKRFTVEEMQNWNKRYKLDKETAKCVIDTFDGGDYCTVHGNEAYNLCIDMNALFDENEQLKKDAQTILFVLCFCKFADGVSMGETEIKAIKRLQKVIGENVIDLKGMGYE